MCGSAQYHYRGQPAVMKTFEDSPKSRADGVTIVLSPINSFRPALSAARTSSSQMNSAGRSAGAGAGVDGGGAGVDGGGGAGVTAAGAGPGAGAGFALASLHAGAVSRRSSGRNPRADRNA